MIKRLNFDIPNLTQHAIGIDISYPSTGVSLPVVIFCHGFKGFKNWGHFDTIATAFAEAGFAFVKFNYSHNGTTLQSPTEFEDLEAFGKNTYSLELSDTRCVIDFVEREAVTFHADPNRIFLIGHSRGGGIVLLTACEDKRIRKLATWAGIKDIRDFMEHMPIEKWEKDGVLYTFNSRTQQNMPLYYSLYEDFAKHREKLDIPAAAARIQQPWLIAHGSADEAVPHSAALQLHQWNTQSKLHILKDAGHTFGGAHPWYDKELPVDTRTLVQVTIEFFLEQ